MARSDHRKPGTCGNEADGDVDCGGKRGSSNARTGRETVEIMNDYLVQPSSDLKATALALAFALLRSSQPDRVDATDNLDEMAKRIARLAQLLLEPGPG